MPAKPSKIRSNRAGKRAQAPYPASTGGKEATAAVAERKTREGTRSVVRASKLLKLIGQNHKEGLSLNELADAAGIPKSSAHRYLQVLEEEGLVERSTRGHYRSGAGFLSLQAGDTERLVERARPHLAAIRDRFDETVNLAMLSSNEIVYLEILESARAMRLAARRGDTEGIHSTALGKAIAAQLPDREVLAILNQTGMAELTPRTITTAEAYLRELERVRASGYALDDRENEAEGRCVAVYVPGCGRPVALSLSAVASRFSMDAAHQAAESLRNAAMEIGGESLPQLKPA